MKFLALDVGEKRIGVARGDDATRIAIPVGFIETGGNEWQEIARIANFYGIKRFIVGLPRNNQGVETAQSAYVREFVRQLVKRVPGIRVKLQDETLTSVLAEDRLKQRGRPYQRGDIDAEAAAIILQDFFDGLRRTNLNAEFEAAAGPTARRNVDASTISQRSAVRANSGQNRPDLGYNLANSGQNGSDFQQNRPVAQNLGPEAVNSVNVGEEAVMTKKQRKAVKKAQKTAKKGRKGRSKGSVISGIVSGVLVLGVLGVAGTFGFLYLRGQVRAERAAEQAAAEAAMAPQVFDFTVLPGETVYDVGKKLIGVGYSKDEVRKAMMAGSYDFPMLKGLEKGATVEGYLFGETKEFYDYAEATEVIGFFLEEMQKYLDENNLEALYKQQGLSLNEGVTLASVVQKEAKAEDMPTVAQVFLSRLEAGIALGSDVTVSYALDASDPEREGIVDNQAALEVDSCYNTRLNRGLPCGAISSPGANALMAVAEPSDTSYLYFLTGDDGLMYYSYTEDEHILNASLHCQNLCNVSL